MAFAGGSHRDAVVPFLHLGEPLVDPLSDVVRNGIRSPHKLVPSVRAVSSGTVDKAFSSIIGAVAKFEGTLQAYTVNQKNPKVEEQVFLASVDLSASWNPSTPC